MSSFVTLMIIPSFQTPSERGGIPLEKLYPGLGQCSRRFQTPSERGGIPLTLLIVLLTLFGARFKPLQSGAGFLWFGALCAAITVALFQTPSERGGIPLPRLWMQPEKTSGVSNPFRAGRDSSGATLESCLRARARVSNPFRAGRDSSGGKKPTWYLDRRDVSNPFRAGRDSSGMKGDYLGYLD